MALTIFNTRQIDDDEQQQKNDFNDKRITTILSFRNIAHKSEMHTNHKLNIKIIFHHKATLAIADPISNCIEFQRQQQHFEHIFVTYYRTL